MSEILSQRARSSQGQSVKQPEKFPVAATGGQAQDGVTAFSFLTTRKKASHSISARSHGWERHKDEIIKLYKENDLETVMEKMEENHGFHPK